MTEKNFVWLQDIVNSTLRNKKPQSREELKNVIEFVLQSGLIDNLEMGSLEEKQREYLIQQVSSSYLFEEDVEILLKNNNEDFDYEWLEKAGLSYPYADRFFRYLGEKWSDTQINSLKKHSLKITSLLGDPRETNCSWRRKGLMIGDVQAGKTANYTAVINRATDIGYQVIVVLTGATESLRKQTQNRLDYEYVGQTKDPNNKQKDSIVGVGKLVSNLKSTKSFTSIIYDFNRKVLRTIPINFDNEKTSLFVIKKNKTVIDCLCDGILKDNKSVNGLVNHSLLLIDDEADYASINVNAKEYDPTAINACIKRLLSIFTRSSYLAVTATPYANIFIDDNKVDDLFPSDYIYILPTPPLYFGADRMFLRTRDTDPDCIEPIFSREMESTYKFGHKNLPKSTKSKTSFIITTYDDLPQSMLKAIRYFFITQCVMDLTPNPEKHKTMMINVTRFVLRQEELFDVVSDFVRVIKNSICIYGTKPEYAKNPASGEFYQLYQIWNEYDFENKEKAGISWKSFCSLLVKNAPLVRVAIVNQSQRSKGSDGLDYNAHPDGDRVIAIGGISLSRGLTLEGLVVSYFYRNAMAYDTLLQMSRWFGYRDKYLCLFKVWMSSDAIDWYTTISEATNHLKRQIRHLSEQTPPGRPDQIGLVVKSNPDYPLIITALGKMRDTKKQNISVIQDISGYFFSSSKLFNNLEINERNAILVQKFINSLGKSEVPDNKTATCPNGRFWENVHNSNVVSLLKAFDCSLLNTGYSINELADYFDKNYQEIKWDIVLNSRDKEINEQEVPFRIRIDNQEIETYPRIRHCDEYEGLIRISKHSGQAAGGRDTAIGLDNEVFDRIKNSKPVLIREDFLMVNRNPLLILYPFVLRRENEQKFFDNLEPVWALGIGIPSATGDRTIKDKTIEIVLNPIAIRKGFNMCCAEEEV